MTNQDWINARDSLPPYGKRVLVRDTIVRIGVRACTDKNGELWELEGREELFINATANERRDVTHWAYLPS